jgi:asparagine synthase (glutamine-hydrolysing)
MCSILGILDICSDPKELRALALRLSKRQRHRGPDWSGIYSSDRAILAHERLAIVDPESGAQPLFSADGTRVLAVNGEIYNHRAIRRRLSSYPFRTGSDCEVILALYDAKGVDFLDELNGIFAFVLYDERADRWLVARDPIGVVPLYMGHDACGNVYFASEMKALIDVCTTIRDFPPGHYLDSAAGPEPVRYYSPAWRDYDNVRGVPADPAKIREALEAAVQRQLMSDEPYGVLLTGGLDSSAITALARRFKERRV